VTDEPIHHGYGYRRFNAGAVSFHRGIDFYTENGENAPVFAAASGIVKSIQWIADNDRTLVLLHPPLGADVCSVSTPCRATIYQHLSWIDPALAVGGMVQQGQFVARTGASSVTGAPQLHFELREPWRRERAVGNATSGNSNYAKDAIDPLPYLPMPRLAVAPLALQVRAGGMHPSVEVSVDVSPLVGYRLDFRRLELESWLVGADGAAALVPPAGAETTAGTCIAVYEKLAEVDGRRALDVESLNRQWSPFPEASTCWTHEHTEGFYYRDLPFPGTDGLLEANASALGMSESVSVAMIDGKLVKPTANPDDSQSGYQWAALEIGFQGITPPIESVICYRARAWTSLAAQPAHADLSIGAVGGKQACDWLPPVP